MKRRWLKRVGWGLLAVVLLLLLLGGSLWLFLQSERGGDWLRTQLVERTNAGIAGTLAVEEVDVRGTLLVLREVVLRGPEGEVVLQVERAEVDVAPRALFRDMLALDRVALVQPELHLVLSEEGSNLQRALAPREPAAPPEPAEEPAKGRPPPILGVRAEQLVLEDGRFTLRPTPEAEAPSLRLAGLDAEGELLLTVPTRTVDVQLHADGQLLAPEQGELSLRLSVEGRRGTYEGRVNLEAAGAVLLAQGRMADGASKVTVKRLYLPDELARAVAPRWPLVVPLALEAELVREGSDVKGSAELDAASASAVVSGHLDTETLRSRGLEVRLRDVNLAELVAKGPKSEISLEAELQGGGKSLEELTGELRVTAPRSPIADTTFGPILIEARAQDGHFVLEQGELSLPGASLTAQGEGTPEQMDVSGNIVATDLRKLSRTLGQVVGPERLPLQGRGRASFSLTGPMRNPTLAIDGRFPLLEYKQQTLRGVNIRLEIPDMVDWLSGEGEYADEGEAQGQGGAGEGQGGAGAGEGKGERGSRPPGQPRLRPALHLRPPGAPAFRGRPARAVLPGRPAGHRPPPLRPFVPPHPVLALVPQRGPIRLEVEVEDVGLEELVRRLGLDISLEGVTEADVKLSGSLEDPRLDARIVVREVLAEGLPPVDFRVRAFSRPSGRLTLELTATALEQPSRVTLQLPYTLGQLMEQRPSREQLLRAPLTVEADIRDFPLPPSLLGFEVGEVKLTDLAQAPRLSGQGKVQGPLLNPEGQLELRLAGLGFEGEVPLVLFSDVELRPERTRVEARVEQQEEVLLRTELQLGASLARLLEEEERGEVALEGQVRLGPVAGERLEPVFRLLSPRIVRVEGLVRADLELGGRVELPAVEGEVEWEDGILETVGFGNYRDIHLLARGQGDRVVLEELVARSAGGAGRVVGRLEREEERFTFQARAELEHFPFVYQDQLWANVSLEATARGTATDELVDISPLRIDEARIELPSTKARELQELDPPENVVFVRNGEPVDVEPEEAPAEAEAGEEGEGEAPEEEDELRWRVAIEAPRNIRVVGDDLDMEVAFGEDFRILREEGETEAFGRIFVRRGRLSFLGRRFVLGEQSQVRFTGPVREPEVDAVATYVNRREDVVVTLAVEGKPGDLSTTLSSTPTLSETEILTLLATGRRQLTPGGGGELDVGAQAVSVLGGFLTRRLERTLDRALPVDFLQIEPGAEGFEGTRVRAGTFVGERLFLGLETQLGADVLRNQNRNEINVEYLLSRRLLLELEYGDARVGSLELRWRRRY